MQPDRLSPAGRDVLHDLGHLARAYPRASAPLLVWMLAAEYIPARLRRKYRAVPPPPGRDLTDPEPRLPDRWARKERS